MEAHIKELEAILWQHVNQDCELDDKDICLPKNIEILTSVNWEEGTEDLKTTSLDGLWTMLSLAEAKTILGVNLRIDMDSVLNPWDPADKAWFENEKNGMASLALGYWYCAVDTTFLCHGHQQTVG